MESFINFAAEELCKQAAIYCIAMPEDKVKLLPPEHYQISVFPLFLLIIIPITILPAEYQIRILLRELK